MIMRALSGVQIDTPVPSKKKQISSHKEKSKVDPVEYIVEKYSICIHVVILN